MRSKPLVLVLSLVLVSGLGALELQRGKVKILVNEKNGRATVQVTEDLASPNPVALYLADDPTTSKMKVSVGDRTLVLGDDGSLSPTYETTPTGGRVTWSSKTFKVVQTYEFLTSQAATVADGVRETVTLTNLGESAVRAGLRVVIDTYLGEKKDHFKLANGDTVNAETKLETSLPDWWLSPSATDDRYGLLMMLGKGATTPSHVVFANWKRIDDAAWEVAVRPGRDFHQLPYSYNDSAVAQYYDAQDLAPGASRDIVLMFGARSAVTFAGAKVGTANVLSDLLQESRTNDGSGSSVVAADQQSLDNLLVQINAKLADPSKVTDEDLKLFKAILDQLEARKAALVSTTATTPRP